ncbi:hypothetical protein SAMN04488503_2640 [Humidesulfovibrio mexicanus]|uniref:Tetratricopeptide repeat-containing protein n=1 Tax=Humidesulfovibrio mexicanus TaxID=147047 RepID=A0A239BMI6_9BACT|nr:hypothetical protein [Humidesulfovibrio mexicanus]SNS08254.1 hypothetical protein SAMN04488503_2640 [Humidesulfovibrio mexicanus]
MTRRTLLSRRVGAGLRLRAEGFVRSLLLLAALALGGCSLANGTQAPPVQEPRAAYVLAVDSYLAGQYEKAAFIFQRLSGDTTDPVLARKAYYGLACSRLATASTPEELHHGLNLWNNWVQMTPEGLPSEDPRLLTPLLPRLTAAVGQENPPMLSAEEIDRELARSKRLAGCQEETGKVKEALRKKTAEAEALRSQLNALERLHREITMKKKGLE